MTSIPATPVSTIDLWPPWASSSQWREANAAIDHLIDVHDVAHLQPIERRALGIRDRLESVSPVMEQLCGSTCPQCHKPCCRVAKPWFDLRDLLFLHFTKSAIAPSQPIRNSRDHCRYLTSHGCSLPRIERPWICIWYLCPAQTEILREETPETARKVERSLKWIGFERKEVEAEWIIRV
jgi:hypothetical protein